MYTQTLTKSIWWYHRQQPLKKGNLTPSKLPFFQDRNIARLTRNYGEITLYRYLERLGTPNLQIISNFCLKNDCRYPLVDGMNSKQVLAIFWIMTGDLWLTSISSLRISGNDSGKSSKPCENILFACEMENCRQIFDVSSLSKYMKPRQNVWKYSCRFQDCWSQTHVHTSEARFYYTGSAL